MGQHRRAPWWAVLLAGLAGALVAILVVTLTGSDRPGSAYEAAATKPAPVSTGETHSVTFIGDSWTEGFGATALRGYAVLTAEQLGWNYQILGVGGSGYSVPGRGSTFGERVDHAVATHPDVIVVQGSLNERTSTPQALTAAADDTLSRLRSEADAHTRILVVGASYTPGTPDATIDWINQAIQGAATKAGLRFVDPAAGNWTDPHDAAIWFDGNHPNDAGYQLVADHLKPLLTALVRN
jgi:lysophospholipase L1-like esterase